MTRNALSIEALGRRANNVLLPHSIQTWDNENSLIKYRYPLPFPQSLNSTAWVVGLASSEDRYLPQLKDRCRAEPWIVLHGWPIEPMARWIQWVTSSWNIGTDWSPIVIICRWFRLSHNRPRWWVLPMYRSSSTCNEHACLLSASTAHYIPECSLWSWTIGHLI